MGRHIAQPALRQSLKRAAQGHWPDGPAELVLACEIALLARDRLVRRARDAGLSDDLGPEDQIRLAEAIAPVEPDLAIKLINRHSGTLAAEVSDRLAAGLYLARPGRVTAPGCAAFLPEQSLPMIRARVNGSVEGIFIIDTGAPHTALSRSWCERHDLHLHETCLHKINDGAGNDIEAMALRLDSIMAGDLARAEARDVPVVLFSFPPGLDLAGILSPLDAFGLISVTVDFAGRCLRIGDAAPSDSRSIPVCWREGVPCVSAMVEGSEAVMMVDTGAGGDVLCESFAASLGLVLPVRESSLSAAGRIEVATGARATIGVSGAARELPVAVKPCILSSGINPRLGLDGFLGLGWMAERSLHFDADRRFMHFT